MKKDERNIILTTISACGALFGVIGMIAADETNSEWENFSGILLGIYLYFVYLIVSIFYAGRKHPMSNYQPGKFATVKRKNPVNEIYEH